MLHFVVKFSKVEKNFIPGLVRFLCVEKCDAFYTKIQSKISNNCLNWTFCNAVIINIL